MNTIIPITGWYALFMDDNDKLFACKIDYVEFINGGTRFLSLDDNGYCDDPSTSDNWIANFDINVFMNDPVEIIKFFEERTKEYQKRMLD